MLQVFIKAKWGHCCAGLNHTSDAKSRGTQLKIMPQLVLAQNLSEKRVDKTLLLSCRLAVPSICSNAPIIKEFGSPWLFMCLSAWDVSSKVAHKVGVGEIFVFAVMSWQPSKFWRDRMIFGKGSSRQAKVSAKRGDFGKMSWRREGVSPTCDLVWMTFDRLVPPWSICSTNRNELQASRGVLTPAKKINRMSNVDLH